MKTFLWTTLFWIIAAIAGLICLGFGNFPGTPVWNNTRLISVMPNNVKDRLASSQTTNCVEEKNPVEEPEVVENEEVIVENEDNNEELMLSLNNIATSQEVIYSQMNSSFAELYQAISNLSVLCSNSASDEIVEPVIDEKEQQRLELQAQIEALQAQMQSL